MKEVEFWTYIKGFEGLYEVSDFGRVRSISRTLIFSNRKIVKPGRIKKLSKNELGYVIVGLSKNGKLFAKRVARLVGIAFLPNPNNLPEINHKKGDKEDNRAWMLEWSSVTANRKHAYDTGLNKPTILVGEKSRYSKLKEDQVREILMSLEGYRKLGYRYGVNYHTVRAIKKRITWTHISIS
jgi:hypothetical protein